MAKAQRNESGVALVTLVIAITIFGILAVAVCNFVSQNTASGPVSIDAVRALYLAEAGISDSFWELKNGEKLYGAPSQPLGLIEKRTVVFADGATGTYEVPEPSGYIVSTGQIHGLERTVRVGVTASIVYFALFAADERNLSFRRGIDISGDAFVNGNVTVYTPTDIDTNRIALYLPDGRSAHYSSGTIFPYTVIDPAPASPMLDIAWYDTMFSLAGSMPAGDVEWKHNYAVPDTVLINGNLSIRNNRKITRSGAYPLVVVTGAVAIGRSVSVEDDISFIARDGIHVQQNATIGATTGKSGNLLFTRENRIIVERNAVVNGSCVSNDGVDLETRSTLNGLLYCNNQLMLGRRSINVRGAVWTGRFQRNRIRGCDIIYEADYLPVHLPKGLTPPGGEVSIEYATNSWREL